MGVLLLCAATTDALDAIQREPPSLHLYGAILLAVMAWSVARLVTWAWER